MSGAFPKRHLRSALTYLGLATFTWLLFFAVRGPETERAVALIFGFSLGASAFSLICLLLMAERSPVRLLPRKSDAFLVLAALPLGGVLQYFIFELLLGVQICPLTDFIRWTPVLALIVYALHYLISLIGLESQQRVKVVLDILPTEIDTLTRYLSRIGIIPYFQFLTRQEMGEHLLRHSAHEIELIVISRGAVRHFDVDAILMRAHLEGIKIIDIQKLLTDISGRIDLDSIDLWTYMRDATKQTPVLRLFSFCKQILEPVLALGLLLLFLPALLCVAMLVRCSGTGPIFFKQVRVGYLGRLFTLYKFRSMYPDAEREGPQWCQAYDGRVTPIGRLLRATRLDELPQLYNVLRGEMSFCGPRPERPEIYKSLKREIPLFSLRTIVRPGITGWAQVCAGYAASVEESRTKLEYDLYYIQNMSPRLDLIILIKTAQLAIVGEQRKVSTFAGEGVLQTYPRHV